MLEGILVGHGTSIYWDDVIILGVINLIKSISSIFDVTFIASLIFYPFMRHRSNVMHIERNNRYFNIMVSLKKETYREIAKC